MVKFLKPLGLLALALLAAPAALAGEMPASGPAAPAPATWRYVLENRRPPGHFDPDDCNVWAERNHARLAALRPFYVVAYIPRFGMLHIAVAYNESGETWVVDRLHGNKPVRWESLPWRYWQREADGRWFWIGRPQKFSVTTGMPAVREDYFSEVR